MSADGSLLAIKTLDRTFVWHRSPGQSIQNLLSHASRPATASTTTRPTCNRA